MTFYEKYFLIFYMTLLVFLIIFNLVLAAVLPSSENILRAIFVSVVGGCLLVVGFVGLKD
jgi:hypothetical protein